MSEFSPLNLSAISVKRKIAVSCVIILLLLLGVTSYNRIGIDILPKFDVPYVQITAVYPGASPEEVETGVARRIEDAVGSLDGLKHTTTICMENAAAITLEFELGTNVDLTLHDVREKLNRIVDDLPEGAETPRLSKLNVNTVPVATLFLCGERTLDELYDYADDKNQISRIPVAMLDVPADNDKEFIILKGYLTRRYAEAKNSNSKLGNIIRYDSLFAYIGIDSGNRKHTKRIRDKVKLILETWKKAGYITGYEEIKEGRTIAKIKIKLPRKKFHTE